MGFFTYVPPYNDADIIAGQGTIGFEIPQQLDVLDNVFISIGGGRLIGGVGSSFKAFHPQVKILEFPLVISVLWQLP
jgi:threonine dehydratase